MKEAEAALAAGKDWNDVAVQIAGQSPDTIELGLMKREELPRVLSDIAFDLPLNKPSEPIKTPLGWHILRIVRIEPGVTQTFEQVKPQLEAQLAHNEAADRIYKAANRVDDALAGGTTIEDAAAKFGLKETEIAAADIGGHDPEGKPLALPVSATEVLKLVFATNEGQTSRVTEGQDSAIFMVRVSKVIPPTIKPLAEVKDQAVAAWQADKRREKVAKTAEELAAAVKPGARLAAAAAEKGIKVTTSPPLLRRPNGVDAETADNPASACRQAVRGQTGRSRHRDRCGRLLRRPARRGASPGDAAAGRHLRCCARPDPRHAYGYRGRVHTGAESALPGRCQARGGRPALLTASFRLFSSAARGLIGPR